ncbi:glyoxalase superfamily protein [Flavobacterium sp. ZS1P70]|uniref:Bleomycin resistance protein n=1 Tax=Flavobacterium zhoui TaxID=3230414 RepID=A0ABW6I2A6_9FLAO
MIIFGIQNYLQLLMAIARPLFRIFDYVKAKEFYIDWLGFTIDWENKPDNSPIYLQISLEGIVIHLTEHHGDCSPGARIHIENFNNLAAYHEKLLSKNYKFNIPSLDNASWSPKIICMEAIDPFGNRLTFTEEI